MNGLSYEELVRDATRYRKMRAVAVETRGLEAFVAIEQLDFCRNTEEFDSTVDEKIEEWS